MNNRERTLAILNYQDYDRMPIVHFGYWNETLEKWAGEGHMSMDLAKAWGDGNAADLEIDKIFGWDFNWSRTIGGNNGLMPSFKRKVLREREDGGFEVMNTDGVTILEKPEAGSIPAEIAHLLTNREAWESLYLPKLQWSKERIPAIVLNPPMEWKQRENPVAIHVGSLLGTIRNWIGVVNLSYMMADDPDLLDEIIETVADLTYRNLQTILEVNDDFDYAHYWEDISFKNGPLVSPRFFRKKVGPYYKRNAELLNAHGITLTSLDSDGNIDKLVPIWLENGVNTMFPIEVGTWKASIAPWREQYGRELRGVGGMNKVVFSKDHDAIDAEIERLRQLVDLGGYIPCPDHRLPPDAKFENVIYYVERMHQVFG
ncbi:MAG: uroporphyrinogen decarboxylase family protein [Anaerolineae bacterium]|jgi:uroporphyrinogen decarboxylase|nr:uroporphyrinogen decarboxylase family protein [Anaerolineae bacterium]